jgi:hypothetical protein
MVKVERREVLIGLGASALALRCSGCFAESRYLVRNVLCATRSFSGLEIGDTLKTSGNPDLDQSLIAEMNKQAAFFGYRPAFILYTGGEKNAAATLDVMPQTPGTDGTILYNIQMLNEQLQNSRWGGAVVAGVIAHEFGHIYQNFTSSMARLKALGPTMKFVELDADFMSGFYMGGKDRTIDLKPYAEAFFKIGDYGFNDADHHGTPEERYFVLKAGYNYRLSKPSAPLADAAREAETVLKEYIH